MTDYGHPITFGVSLYPSVDELATTMRLASLADGAGLDYLAIQDHAYNPEFLDTWTLITYLAAETERITFVPDVARPPAAATDDPRQGGRVAQRAERRADRARRRRRRAAPTASRRWAARAGAGREMVEFTEEASASCAAPCAARGVAFRSRSSRDRGLCRRAGTGRPDPALVGRQRRSDARGHWTLERRLGVAAERLRAACGRTGAAAGDRRGCAIGWTGSGGRAPDLQRRRVDRLRRQVRPCRRRRRVGREIDRVGDRARFRHLHLLAYHGSTQPGRRLRERSRSRRSGPCERPEDGCPGLNRSRSTEAHANGRCSPGEHRPLGCPDASVRASASR